MKVRVAKPSDAQSIADIYAPIVRDTAISFELEPPSAAEMRSRISETLKVFPWLVSVNGAGEIDGYAYASRHRARAAYRWSVDSTVYVRADSRRGGVGRRLYNELFTELVRLGYCETFAGIALPNDASIALHRSVGFEPVGTYRGVGFKLGAWHDVSWWQKSLGSTVSPTEPIAFGG
jgi:L-amino acid N-acyltransferase YncA